MQLRTDAVDTPEAILITNVIGSPDGCSVLPCHPLMMGTSVFEP